ncbi:2-phospho-L-lactate guanylyltransferase [Solirubrobacter pauli]|uniref:Phosphoenolpyruvate guanylyltransferase n=1 Tax=Solirubrobacter pauli TaxID=166793 RepID=A0A660L876_9ACTN|nr:NTP transferase domain-containing protein [Solirubrobacter pauli]RKQ90576.1 2-phospho-L-lactate guanylyltransferase [Solirubrobacter pauli]
MRTVAILPVKSFGRAKQRLGHAFPDRPALAAAMVADVLEALAAVPSLDGVIVVTAEPIAAEIARGMGAQVVHDPDETGQSDAAARGVAAALGRDVAGASAGGTNAGAARDGVVLDPAAARADRVLLVPGDCPALDPDEVEALLGRRAPVVIVPDRHGTGTNALLLSPPDVMAPAFGEGSFERHSGLASAAGAEPDVADVRTLGLDVDTPDDLAALRRALEIHPGGAVRTRALLDQAIAA